MAKHKKEEGTRSASAARANIRYERVRLKWLPKLFNVRKVLKCRLEVNEA